MTTESGDSAALARIEQLLQEGNALRREAIGLQRESVGLQQALVEEQKANLAMAQRVNEGALAIQQRARAVLAIVIPVLVVLIGYVSYLLFFRSHS